MGQQIKKGATRTALITGATVGIGYELAKLFAKDGYDLVLVARDRKRLRSVAAEWKQEYGIAVKTLAFDLASPDSPGRIYDALQRSSIQVDVLVNNAGFGGLGDFLERSVDESMRMIQVNASAVTHLTRLFLPGMVERKQGKILNVASTAAFQPGPTMAVYYATKAYVLSFSEALAEELRGSGVTVTALCPGPTRTEFQMRAEMEEIRLFNKALVMDAPEVAAIGYDALKKGRTVVVAGLTNKVLVQSIRFAPRKLPPKIVKFLHAKR